MNRILVFLGVVLLLLGLYFTLFVPEKPINSSSQGQKITAEAIARQNENSLACKKVAGQAIELDRQQNSDQTLRILGTHFIESTSECYYEVLVSDQQGSFIQTEIRVSPDDEWIVSCGTVASNTICNQHNKGLITEEQYKSVRDYYFNAT